MGNLLRDLFRDLFPALLLALFGGWSGTFYYGASAPAVMVGHLALLGAAAWGWRSWDPLRLGPRAKALAPLLWLWVVLAMRASAVSRAGWLAVSLLPAFLALPAVFARCWPTPAARRRGALAVGLTAGAIGALALGAMAWQGSARAAQPLGNAVVLGGFLAVVAPIALVAAMGERGGWRWPAAAALALALAGLLATRSLAAVAAAVVGAAVALPRGRKRWLLVPLLAGALLLAPRLLRLAVGDDGSLQARSSYWQGGLRGAVARPLLGWGPGGTAWTLAPLVRPRPGANPPGEVPADLHSLPLQLAYELGLPGLAAALALAIAFVRARLRERPSGERDTVGRKLVEPGSADRELRRAGLAGLAAGATALSVGPTLGTTAPWIALALAAGAALSGSPEAGSAEAGAATSAAIGGAGASPAAPARRRTPRVGWLYAAVGLLLLVPLDAALACYDAARRAAPAQRGRWMALAVELDPEMPLYRARLGWLAPTAPRRALELARAAAAAPGVGALQLAAGWAARVAGQPSQEALAAACNDDPLLGAAPLLLALGQPRAPWAPRLGARAVLADPPLLAAIGWEAQPELRRAALLEVSRWQGVDAGLRKAIVDVAASLPLPRQGAIGRREIRLDGWPPTAASLHAFRRLPWAQTLAVVEVRLADARLLSGLPGAGSLLTTRRGAFPQPCLPAPPGPR